MSDSLWLHEPQHARPPCPSPTPRVHPNPCPSSRWCHPTMSASVIPFSSCPQSFPASGSFQMNQPSASGGQSIGVSASTSVPPMNISFTAFIKSILCTENWQLKERGKNERKETRIFSISIYSKWSELNRKPLLDGLMIIMYKKWQNWTLAIFEISDVIIDLSKNYQWLLKSLDKLMIRNRMFLWQQSNTT